MRIADVGDNPARIGTEINLPPGTPIGEVAGADGRQPTFDNDPDAKRPHHGIQSDSRRIILHVGSPAALGGIDGEIQVANQYLSILRQPAPGFGKTKMLRLRNANGTFDEDRKSTRLNSSHSCASRMPSAA